MDGKLSLKGAWSGSHDPFSVFMPAIMSPEWLKLESPNFVCGYNMLGITAVLEVGRYETVCLAFLTILC